jgi:glucose/arabinose dehydrogenase
MRLHSSTALAVAALMFVLVVSNRAAQSPPGVDPPRVFDTNTRQRIPVVTVASGLVHPWSIAFPDGRTMLVAERAGRLRIIRDGVLDPDPVWNAPAEPVAPAVPPAATGTASLDRLCCTGIEDNSLRMKAQDLGNHVGKVLRITDEGGVPQPSQAERRELLLTQLDIRIRDVVHGPDGCLYVATEKVSGGNNPDGTVLRIEPAE